MVCARSRKTSQTFALLDEFRAHAYFTSIPRCTPSGNPSLSLYGIPLDEGPGDIRLPVAILEELVLEEFDSIDFFEDAAAACSWELLTPPPPM